MSKLTWAPRNYSEDRHILLPDFLRGPIFELMMFIEYKITKGGLLKTYSDELYSKFTMGFFVIEEGPDYKVVYIKQALKKAGVQ